MKSHAMHVRSALLVCCAAAITGTDTGTDTRNDVLSAHAHAHAPKAKGVQVTMLSAHAHAHAPKAKGVQVTILSPGPCKVYLNSNSKVSVPLAVRVEGSSSEGRLDVQVKSSQHDEVWMFDVPPTPHTSSTFLHYQLDQSTPPAPPTPADHGDHGQGAIDGGAGMRENQPGDVHVREQLQLPSGCHTIKAQFVSAQTGIPEVEPAYVHICIGTSDAAHDQASACSEVADKARAKAASKAEDTQELEAAYQKVSRQYTLKHPELNEFREEYLHPDLRAALAYHNTSALHRIAHRVQGAADVFILPVLSDAFMQLVEDELEHAQQQSDRITWTRPNTMNHYGFVLEELGLQGMLDSILHRVLAPLASQLLPSWGAELDAQHTFTIRYAVGEDLDLDRHMDQSEVTLNVCIGGHFKGAEVFFQGQRDHPSQHGEDAQFHHRRGFGLLHAGQHWHGSNILREGRRQNLIMWGRSSNFHESASELFCKACGHGPSESQSHTPGPQSNTATMTADARRSGDAFKAPGHAEL